MENLWNAALLPATVIMGISAGVQSTRAARATAIAEDAQIASGIYESALDAQHLESANMRHRLTNSLLDSDDLREQLDDMQSEVDKLTRERNVAQRERLELATTCHRLLDEIERLRRRPPVVARHLFRNQNMKKAA